MSLIIHLFFVNHRLLKDAQLFVQTSANSMSAWKTHGPQNEHVHTRLSILTGYILSLYDTVVEESS